jgi:hypothetical protein
VDERRILRAAAAFVICVNAMLAHAQPRSAPGTNDGVVTDTNLVSLANASASILGSSLQVVTGANGRFRIIGVSAGHYILIVRRLGYAPTSSALEVGAGDTLRMSFALVRSVALDTVRVATKRSSMRLAEFEDRRRAGVGHFITQAEIDRRNSVFVADLLRTVVSVTIAEKDDKQIAANLRSGNACPFLIVLDGVPLPMNPPPNLRDLPSPKELAGIEIYSGPATLPLQYKSAGTGCGEQSSCGPKTGTERRSSGAQAVPVTSAPP